MANSVVNVRDAAVLMSLLTAAAFTAGACCGGRPGPPAGLLRRRRAERVTLNGLTCKPPADVSAADFASQLLLNPAEFDEGLGLAVNLAFAANFPALNTQGLSVARIDFKALGLNPPHVHPRATEVAFLVNGTLTVGFVTSDTADTLFQQTLQPGDLFVFPRGLVHFQFNPDQKQPALAIAALNSQNPGVSQSAANPPLPKQVLQTALGIDQELVAKLEDSIRNTLA